MKSQKQAVRDAQEFTEWGTRTEAECDARGLSRNGPEWFDCLHPALQGDIMISKESGVL